MEFRSCGLFALHTQSEILYVPYVQSGGTDQHHQLSSGCSPCKQIFAGSNGHAMLNQWHGHVMFPGIYNVSTGFEVIW